MIYKFKCGNGLLIYIQHDYISYLTKIKMLCNLKNYETYIIDESNKDKLILMD